MNVKSISLGIFHILVVLSLVCLPIGPFFHPHADSYFQPSIQYANALGTGCKSPQLASTFEPVREGSLMQFVKSQWPCTKGILKGMYNSTWVRAQQMGNCMYPQNWLSCGKAAHRSLQQFGSVLMQIHKVLPEAYAGFKDLDFETRNELICSFGASFLVDLSIGILTAGAGSAGLAQLMNKLKDLLAMLKKYGAALAKLKIPMSKFLAAIAKLPGKFRDKISAIMANPAMRKRFLNSCQGCFGGPLAGIGG